MSWGSLYNQERVREHVHVNIHLGRKRDFSSEEPTLTELKAVMTEIGMYEDSFLPEGSGYESFMHLTAKFKAGEGEEFRATKRRVREILLSHTHLYRACYQENEVLPVDMRIQEKVFDPTVSIPFTTRLGQEEGVFKEAELHASARDRTLVIPQGHAALLRMGFCEAYLPKPEGTVAAVYTIAGSLKHIRLLAEPTYQYLQDGGGFPKGSLKVEVMVDPIEVFGERGIIEMMPLIQEINFAS